MRGHERWKRCGARGTLTGMAPPTKKRTRAGRLSSALAPKSKARPTPASGKRAAKSSAAREETAPSSVAGLIDEAVRALLAIPAKRLFELADQRNVPFYPKDRNDDWQLCTDRYANAEALRAALSKGDAVARRSAMFLLVSANPDAAWPILRRLLAKPPPAPSRGLELVVSSAPGLLVTIPRIPDHELLEFFEDPRIDWSGLADAVLYHRKDVASRLGVFELALQRPMQDGTWRLAESIYEELQLRSGKRLLPILRRAAAEDRGWRSWARELLAQLGDSTVLESEAEGLDAKQPQRAINATIALGPERFAALRERFFTPSALKSRAGRTRAASILHSILTRVMIEGDKRWRKDAAFVALVDQLANPAGDSLAFGAASLAGVLRGKKPLSRGD